MPDPSGTSMRLRVLLPSEVYADVSGVTRIVAPTLQGSFGLWPRRLDCAAALAKGILAYESAAGEVFVAIDAGVLVKAGAEVTISVRRAVGGADLARLHEAVERTFAVVDADQRSARAAMGRIEADLMRRFTTLHDG